VTQPCQELIQVTQKEASEVPSIKVIRAIHSLLWHGCAEAVACNLLLWKVLGSYCSKCSNGGMLSSPVCCQVIATGDEWRHLAQPQ